MWLRVKEGGKREETGKEEEEEREEELRVRGKKGEERGMKEGRRKSF